MKRLLLALTVLLSPAAAFAQSNVPTLVSYHGRVVDATGVAIGNAAPVNRKVWFRVYSAPTGGTSLYSEFQTVTIAAGEFSVLIGAGAAVGTEPKPVLDTVFNGSERYLGVTVDDGTTASDTEISPRQQMTSTAFAFRAKVAEALAGSVSTAQIADGAITLAKVAGGAVGYGKIAQNAVDSAIIIDGNVTEADLGTDAVTTIKIKNANVTADKLATDSVTFAKIAGGAVGYGKVAHNTVDSAIIIDGNVAEVDLAADAVTSAKIKNGTIASDDIANGAITDVKLGASSVTQGAIAANSILASHISASQVTNAKIGDGAITTGKLADLNVTTAKIADGNVTTGKLASSFFSTYQSFTGGLRANAGLNVNHPGTAGITSTIKAGSTDTQILEIRDKDDLLLFRFGPAGVPYNIAGGNWFSYSDLRLKKNIEPLGGVLEKLLRLRSVTFEYKEPARYGAGERTGFIAQEVEKIFPDWVVTEADGLKSVGSKGFESLTVQALRELRAEKDEQLKQRDTTIAALEKNVAAMKSEAAETKARLATLEQALAKFSAAASN